MTEEALEWAREPLLDARWAPGSLWHALSSEPRRPRLVRESPQAHWYVVGTVCIGAFMGQLDASIVTLALARPGRDLHASVGAVEWVALAYLLVLVASVANVGVSRTRSDASSCTSTGSGCSPPARCCAASRLP